jgi:hypothetical protein
MRRSQLFDTIIRESNIGKPGIWIYLIGDRRRYGRFRMLPAGTDEDSNDGFAPIQRAYIKNMIEFLLNCSNNDIDMEQFLSIKILS